MKTLLGTTVLTALFATTAFADNTPNTETQHIIALSVFDVSSSAPKNLNTTTLSRSAKQQLCWIAEGSFNPQVNATEVFTSPAKATFQVEKQAGISTASADKKTHTVTTRRESLNNGKNVTSCWNFNEKDPRGKYTLKVQIDNIQFEPLSFTIVK